MPKRKPTPASRLRSAQTQIRRLVRDYQEVGALWGKAEDRADKAEAEVDRLRSELAAERDVLKHCADVAEEAEAKLSKLKAASEDALSYLTSPGFGADTPKKPYVEVVAALRAALYFSKAGS